VLVLFGVIGIMLIAMLSAQPHIPPATPVTPTEVVVVPTATATEPPAQNQAAAYTQEEITKGQSLFASTCTACHGPDAKGIPGLGKNLTTSTFVHDLTDDELLHFINVGRPVTDPLNTTGVAMPPKGANPSLTDDQIHLIIAYIRSLQVKAGAGAAAPAPTSAPTSSEPTKAFQLPIDSMGLGAATATPTTAFQLPINSMNLATATESAPATTEATAAPTEPPTAVPTTAPTGVASATPTSAGGFQLPINSMSFPTATATP
jgi:disulfide bond formation protein DsbB